MNLVSIKWTLSLLLYTELLCLCLNFQQIDIYKIERKLIRYFVRILGVVFQNRFSIDF